MDLQNTYMSNYLRRKICLIDRIISCAPLNSQFCLIILDSTSCCYMYMYSKLFNILGFDLTPTLINEREVHYFHDLENLTGHCSMDKNNHALEICTAYKTGLQFNIKWSGILLADWITLYMKYFMEGEPTPLDTIFCDQCMDKTLQSNLTCALKSFDQCIGVNQDILVR